MARGGRPRPGARGAHAPPRDCLFFESASRVPYHASMRCSSILLLAALSACAASVGVRVPSRVGSQSNPAQLERVAAAQRAADAGDIRGALAALDAIRAEGLVVEAERLRQDILRQRGRLGALRAEAEARVAAQPDSGASLYLLGRLQPPQLARATFQAAAQKSADSVWPWLGLAFAMRDSDPAGALAIYERLHAASEGLPTVAIAYANSLRSAGKLREAVAVYEALLQRGGDSAGIAHLGLAQTLFALGKPEDRARAWGSFLSALRDRPGDPGVHGILREILRAGAPDDQIEQCLDALRESSARWRAFARGAGAEILAALLPRLQQPQAALAAIEAIPTSERAPEIATHRRRLLLACGDARAFHRSLHAELPRARIDAEDNQVRAVWRSLLSVCEDGDDPLAGADRALRYVAALRDVGMLVEAELCATIEQRLRGDTKSLSALMDEVRAEIAFENALRRLLYRGYAKDEPADLGALLAEVRRVSVATLGRDVTSPDVRFSVPFVGEMLDPFAAGLCKHLARYNRHLALGRRAGGVPEGLMFTRLSLRDLPEDPALPVPGRCREVLGTDRSVRSMSGVLGGDLAGVALMNHYIVDHDAVVEWAQAIARRQRVVAEDGGAALADAMPDRVDAFDPLDVNFRLSATSSMQDIDLVDAVLETICLHERRHLVDSFHYMPVESNLWRSLGLLLQSGFSAHAIESEMERRAELAALAYSRRPEIVLAHISEFLEDEGGDGGSPHVRGFTQLGQRLATELGGGNGPVPVSRWHGLDPEAVRRTARRMMAELPMGQPMVDR